MNYLFFENWKYYYMIKSLKETFQKVIVIFNNSKILKIFIKQKNILEK